MVVVVFNSDGDCGARYPLVRLKKWGSSRPRVRGVEVRYVAGGKNVPMGRYAIVEI